MKDNQMPVLDESGNLLAFESGGNTTLRGAVARGEQVIANVGKDLTIESLQDLSTYDSKQKSAGVSVSLCILPFCVGATPVSGSVSASASKMNSNYASVTEQSALRAGDGGFDVKVKNDTDLKGGRSRVRSRPSMTTTERLPHRRHADPERYRQQSQLQREIGEHQRRHRFLGGRGPRAAGHQYGLWQGFRQRQQHDAGGDLGHCRQHQRPHRRQGDRGGEDLRCGQGAEGDRGADEDHADVRAVGEQGGGRLCDEQAQGSWNAARPGGAGTRRRPCPPTQGASG
ncbi:MAG: hemagglutinin repeat-containing protein [Propionivibrio sp.]|nr:hemagglutinin repeat-containing protein [Propionivibrio sp.]